MSHNTATMIPRNFFQRDPVVCARELVGCTLKWGPFSAMIVETEAYDSQGDEACHTYNRPSGRAFVESHQAGAAYVYLNYGVHWMINVLVKGQREGFVFLRALEPLEGIEEMKRRRKSADLTQLCSGPGKLTQALGIAAAHHGLDLCTDPAYGFYSSKDTKPVEATSRIGISRALDLPWRFCAVDNRHLSAPQKKEKSRTKTVSGV